MSPTYQVGDIHVVVGGQYGSEAKGHVAAQIHQRHKIHFAVRIGGPNAGHSAVDADGNCWALRQIPVGAVVDPDCLLVIGAGSEIDPTVLQAEIEMLENAGFNIQDRLIIDGTATILEPKHIATEQALDIHAKIGSTAKGIGAARADRLMRTASLAKDRYTITADTSALLQNAHVTGEHILIEGTQGYGLGLHAGNYPHATSGDCRAIDFLAQTGLTPLEQPDIWLVFRTYPIRVAGLSGEMLNETDWQTLNDSSGGYIQAERTTVTKKIRRVGEWDIDLALDAIRSNGTHYYDRLHTCLMFVDYLDPTLAWSVDHSALKQSEAYDWIQQREAQMRKPFTLFGTSSSTAIWSDRP